MNKNQIDRFFKVLANQFNEEAIVILTGAAAGAILGHIRPSVDIDFSIELIKHNDTSWEKLDMAISNVVKLTGIQANYAEDIDRWGLISLLDYKRHTHYYKRFGRLSVRLLDPVYWSIGKMTRYLDPDIRDMVQVFKKQHIPPDKLVYTWGRAIKKSPRSTALIQFRKQVEDFLFSYGRAIWGKDFNSVRFIQLFHKEGRIKTTT